MRCAEIRPKLARAAGGVLAFVTEPSAMPGTDIRFDQILSIFAMTLDARTPSALQIRSKV
jgi:hypothetical protein